MNALFITATGTDAGKTYVSALLLKALLAEGVKAGYYKPVCSGGLGDAEFVSRETDIPLKDAVSYCYQTPVSPHLAAKLEMAAPPSLDKILKDFKELQKRFEFLVVEGAGGIITPFRYDETPLMQIDVVKAMNAPVLIVTHCSLGAINSAALTHHYLKARGVEITGFVANRYDGSEPHKDNLFMIERLTGGKILAKLGERESEIRAVKGMLVTLIGGF